MTVGGEEGRRRQEAAAWLARLNRRTVSTDELQRFYEWRQHPGNSGAYAEAERVWRESRALGADADIAASVEEALERPQPRAWSIQPLLLAGGIALAGLGALLLLIFLNRPEYYRTGVGEQRLIALKDGSRIRLNTDTELTVRLSGTRQVELLHGQAYFDVHPDPDRPFAVRAGAAEVRALGTSFDVRREDRLFRVVLAEGSVLVVPSASGAEPKRLAPGEGYLVPESSGPQLFRADLEAATGWTSGRMVFKRTRLDAAIAEANRYSIPKIKLRSPSLAGLEVDGAFEAGDLEAFSAALTALLPLKAQRDGEGNIILTAIPR